MARTQIIAEPGSHQILTAREFSAPPELLFRARVDPDLLVRWLGPRSLSLSVERMEVKDGGRWRFIHRDPDGNEHAFRGVFHGTPSPDGIVRTFEYEGAPGHVCLETLTFEEHGDRTILRANVVFQSVRDRDEHIASGMEAGLNDSMVRLDELLPVA